MPGVNLKQIFLKNKWLPWAALAVLVVFLLILALILFPSKSQVRLTPAEIAWIKAHPIVKLAPNPNAPPLEYFDEQGNYTGLVADYLAAIEEQIGVKFQYVRYESWAEVRDAMESGQVDGVTALQANPSSGMDLQFTSPLISIPDVIITKNWSGNLSFADMEGWSLAITRGYPSVDEIHRMYPYITIIESDNDLQALQAVSTDRANAALVNQAVASYLIEKHGITGLRIVGDSGEMNPISIGIRADEPELFGLIEKGLSAIPSEERNEITKKWIALTSLAGEDFTGTSQFWLVIFWAVMAITIILGVSLTWNRTLQTQVSTKTKELNRELTDRISAETKLNQQLQNMSALRAIGVAINASMDLPLTLNILLDQVCSKLNVDACTILLLNPFTRNLEHSADRGFRTPQIRETRLDAGSNSFAWKAVQTRKMVIENLAENPGSFSQNRFHEMEGFVYYVGAPLISKGAVKGILEIFHRSSLPIDQDWTDFLESIASQAAIAIDNASMFQSLQRANLDITLAYDATIEGWAKALELRDGNTEGHSKRVTQMTVDLAGMVGFRNEELIHIRRGAILHDIGKMGIPDHILLKPGPLTPEEWEIMKKHPTYARDMLRNVHYLEQALDIPYSHHERWDGTGYPQGLRAERIPLPARVFSVIDVWDALVSDRPYRKAWTAEETLQYIRDNAGIQFDPMVVEEFIRMMSRSNQLFH